MAEAGKPPRASFLTDPFTTRDIFGVCRGACTQCGDCGRYLKATADYTVSAGEQGRRHPDNDPSITHCSRCGCPPEAHEVAEQEQERELGNDAFAAGRFDAAVAHYSRALGLGGAPDAALWSNRAAAYLAKGWPQQALHDADHALALRPDWAKPWGRKGAALLQLGRPAEAAAAYQRGLQLSDGTGGTALREGLALAQAAVRRAAQTAQAAERKRHEQERSRAGPQPARGGASQRASPAAAAGSVKPQPVQPTPSAGQGSSVGAPAQQAEHCSASAGEPGNAAPQLQEAWQQLQRQAALAAAAVAELQRQVGQFGALLQTAGLPAEGAAHRPSTTAAGQQAAAGGTLEQGPQLQPPPQETGGQASVQHSPGPQAAASAPAAAAAAAGGCSPATACLEADANGGVESSEGCCGPQQHNVSESCASSSASSSDVEDAYSEAPPAPAAAVSAAEAAAAAPVPAPPASPPAAAQVAAAQPTGELQGAGSSSSSTEDCSAGSLDGWSPGPSEGEEGLLATEGSSCSSNSSCSSEQGSEQDSSRGGGEPEDAEPGAEAEWLAAVEAARRQLAAAGEGATPPPRSGRRPPKATGAGSAAAGGALGLSNLQQLCAAAEAAALAKDAAGVQRAACKRCGAGQCGRFRPVSGPGFEAAVAAQLGGAASSDRCAACGCAGSDHETVKEAATREARLRRQRLRLERQARGSTSAAGTTSATDSGLQPERAEARQRRVAATAERRAAAAAAREQLQEADCDVLSHQRRGACAGCTSCPGFRLLYRTCDAHDPEVMFYCSLCGCRADQHAADAAWEQQEAARRAAEAAAAQRRQAAAGAAASAAAAARSAEAQAYATLGLPLGADAKSVARAYKRLALQLHPDKQQSAAAAAGAAAPAAEAAAAAAAANERFVQVAAAYRLLTEQWAG